MPDDNKPQRGGAPTPDTFPWQSWYTGVHEDDSGIIIDSLLECVDDFSKEFLEVNPDSD